MQMHLYVIGDMAVVLGGAFALVAAFRVTTFYWAKTHRQKVMPLWLGRVLSFALGAWFLFLGLWDLVRENGAMWR